MAQTEVATRLKNALNGFEPGTGDSPIIALMLIIGGGYLAWFGVHYWRSDVTWPSDPVKKVLQGKKLPATGASTTSSIILLSAESTAGNTGGKSPGGNVPVPPGAKGNAAQNQNIAKLLCAGYGWAPQQNMTEWNALVDMWNQESGWNQYADTRKTGLDPPNATVYAYGIPQARPASKMVTAGADWMTNPRTQIIWGLRYIKHTYGSPSAAWAFDQTHGGY